MGIKNLERPEQPNHLILREGDGAAALDLQGRAEARQKVHRLLSSSSQVRAPLLPSSPVLSLGVAGS